MQVAPSPSARGFFASLFDFSFSSLITTKIVKIVYVIATILIGLASLGFFVAWLTRGGVGIVIAIIGAPILFIVYMIVTRIWLEIVIIVFRIGEDVRRIADAPRSAGPAVGGYQPPQTGFPPPPPAPPVG